MKTTLDFALFYASKGIKVFPCKIDKGPLTRNGFKDASTDEKQIREWFSGKDNSIGIPTGKSSGWLVLDIDFPDGPASLEKLCSEYGPLPETKRQQTGSGASQLFFRYPDDVEIRSSASKIGPGLDIRGEGGYIIAPPSGHPSGGNYKWLTNGYTPLADLPDWLKSLLTDKPKDAPSIHAPSEGTTHYGRKALESECSAIALAPNGTRNPALNTASFSVAQLVAGGEIDEHEARNALYFAAQRSGLEDDPGCGPKGILATIASGFRAGMAKPRKAELSDTYDSVRHVRQMRQDTTAYDTGTTENGFRTTTYDSVTKAQVKDWVIESEGWFQTEAVYREFVVHDRHKKQYLSRVLQDLARDGLVKVDPLRRGWYCYVNTDVDFINMDAEDESSFPVVLPLNLSDLVELPNGVAVIAGSTNGGKTAFLMDLMRLNFHQPYEKLYLMSEMHDSEWRRRCGYFGLGRDPWKAVKATNSKRVGYDVLIKKHNPNGLTTVDYLEEKEGEYFKMGSLIREIYDSVKGLCFIAIQKRESSEFGRGGEATKEKARLYLTVDPMIEEDRSVICHMKITKAKCYKGLNPNGRSRLFRIRDAAHFEPLTEWEWMNEKERQRYAEEAHQSNKFNVNFKAPGNDICPFNLEEK